MYCPDRYSVAHVFSFSPPLSFSYPVFAVADPLVLAGAATIKDEAVSLTANGSAVSAGGVWNLARVWVDEFEANCSFYISGPPAGGSDGLALVFWQNASPPTADAAVQQIGGLGYGGGISATVDSLKSYDGLPSSVAIEFDTFQDVSLEDPPSHHVSVHSRGTESNSANESARVGHLGLDNLPGSFRLQSNVARISYSAQVLRVYLNGLTSPTVSVTIDIAALIGGAPDGLFLGVTSSLGQGSGDSHTLQTWSFRYTGNQLAARNCLLSGSGWTDREVTAGVPEVFYIEALDRFNHSWLGSGVPFAVAINSVGGDGFCTVEHAGGENPSLFKANFTAIAAGDTTVQVTTVNGNVVVATRSVKCIAGAFAPRFSQLGGQFGGGTVGQQLSFSVTMTDKFGNRVAPPLAKIDVSFSAQNGPEATVQPCGSCDGLYTVIYSSDKLGTFDMTVKVDAVEIKGSPFAVAFSSGEIEPSQSTASGKQLAGGQAGVPIVFQVQMRDKFSNPVSVNANVTVSFFPSITQEPVVTLASPGRYNVTYVAKEAGYYSFSVYTNNVVSSQSPYYRIRVNPGPADIANVLFLAPAAESIAATLPFEFLLTARDAHNNTLFGVAPYSLSASLADGSSLNSTEMYDYSPGRIALRVSGPPSQGSPLVVSASAAPSGPSVAGSPYEFEINPGPIWSSIVSELPSSIPVGSVATIFVRPFDIDGAPILAANLTMLCDPPLTILASQKNGVVSITFAPTNSGLYRLSILPASGPSQSFPLTGFPRVLFATDSSSSPPSQMIVAVAFASLAFVSLVALIVLCVFRQAIRNRGVTLQDNTVLSFNDTEDTIGASDLAE